MYGNGPERATRRAPTSSPASSKCTRNSHKSKRLWKRTSPTIRNSTAEFLIFQLENREDGIQLLYSDETLWLTQEAISLLFDKSRSTIAEHLQNVFASGELAEDSVCRKFRQTAADGKKYQVKYYNLDAVISVGYRVNSVRATQFRQWCTNVLRQFAIRGYVIDKQRMENGTFLNVDYFEHLLEEIREIRMSERRFYQKITDIYATSIDYNPDAPTTRIFFKKVQNKMHYAVHGHTAAELIVERVNAEKEHMGRIVSAFLDLAEDRAKRHIPMTMEDWATRIDKFLEGDDRPVLDDAGRVSAEYAKEFAETEFEKYRVIQDRLFQSDFDRLMNEDDLLELPKSDK